MKILKQIMVLFSVFVLGFGQECDEPIDMWFKVSNEEGENYGKILKLDMSMGYADTDGHYVYLFVKDVKGDGVIISFPIGYWEVKKIEKSLDDYDNFDEYLKSLKGKGTKIQKIIK